LIIFGYGVRFLFEVFQNEPIALGMVLILSIQPVLVLLAIFAVRGGMMALKVTRGTDLNSLGKVVFRIVRFNLPLMWAVTVLFGLDTTVTGLRLLNSNFITEMQKAKDVDSMRDIATLIELIGQFPLFLIGGWLIGACVSFALLGVSVAAQSAMAAVKPPSHHSIWGMASQFVNLLLLALMLVIVPFIGAIYMLGMDPTLVDLTTLDPIAFYGALGYGTWSICALAAGAALAYSLTLKSEEKKHQDMLDAISGNAMPQVDLKSLREARMKK
jgi:hypothetical protein